MKKYGKKVKLGALFFLSTSTIVTPILSTSCNETSTQKNFNIDRTKLSEGDAQTLSKKFINSVNKLVNDIKLNKIQISPKYEYKSMYANNKFWNIEKITDEYFDGLPTSVNGLNIQNVAITYFDSPNGAMDLEVLIQNSKNEDEFTYRVITINGFEKEPIGLVLNRVYSEDSIKISPNWTNNKVSFATQTNWPIEKITSDNFYNLLEPKYGIQPKLVDVIYDGSELGQLKLVYDFYYEEQLISTKMYTVSGFAKEDLVDKVNRLYGNLKIKPKRSATKYSANSLIWTTNKIISVWFDGLPQNQEGITISVKEVITNAVLESKGALEVVFAFNSKNGKSIEKTFEIKGFYKDPDIAAYNLILAKEAFENIKLKRDLEDLSNFELKDLYYKKTKLEDIFEIPNIPYVKMDYEVFCWRNWWEVSEKFGAGSFKIKFYLVDVVNWNTISVMSKTFGGMYDVLGKWNEEFIFNKSWNHLIAKKENISWEKFYTSKGKGGLWDYSREGVIAARGQQNAVWIPIPLFTILGTNIGKAKNDIELMKKYKVKNLEDVNKKRNKLYGRINEYRDSRYLIGEQDNPFYTTIIQDMESLADILSKNKHAYFVEKWKKDYLSKNDHYGWVKGKYGIDYVPSDNRKIFTKNASKKFADYMFESEDYLKIKEYKDIVNDWEKNGAFPEYSTKRELFDGKIKNNLMLEAETYFNYQKLHMKDLNIIASEAKKIGIDFDAIVKECKIERNFGTSKGGEYKTYDWILDTSKMQELLYKKANFKYNVVGALVGFFVDILLSWVIPPLMPIYQSKADLTLLADWQNYYRYTLLTVASDAKYSFGFIPPSQQRLINLLTYDSENDKNPLTIKDIDLEKKYARKGAIEALRQTIIKKYVDENNELIFDSIEYESFNGIENCLKLPNGKENGLWSSDAYWFLSNYTFTVNYEDESLSIPFQMWLGAVDQIEFDTQYVIGDDSDLDRPQYHDWGAGIWFKDWNRWKSDQSTDSNDQYQFLKYEQYKKLMNYYNANEKQWQDALRNVYKAK